MNATSSNSGYRLARRGWGGRRPPRGATPSNRGKFDARRGTTGADSQGRPGGAIFMQDQPVAVDARITDDSDKAVVAKLNTQPQPRAASAGTGTSTGTDDPDHLPFRPDFGTQGREIALRTNYFPVQVQGDIYRYSVAISLTGDKKLTRHIKHRVFELAEQSVGWQQTGMLGRVAHDNAERLVASFLLPQPLVLRGIYHDGDQPQQGTEYILALSFEEQVDQRFLNDCLAGEPVDSRALAKVLSALNLVLIAHPSRVGVKIGRGDDTKKHPDQRLFFDSPEPKDIGGGLTAREGFYVSVRPAHQQLMVNVNTCHAAFYKPQNFADAWKEHSQLNKDGTGAFGKRVRVETRPSKNVVTIQGISKQNAREHGTKSQPPSLVLLEGPNGSRYPPEVCDILPNQAFKGELTNSKLATAMLDAACKPPKENANEVVNRGINMLGFRDSNPVLDSFGVSVGTEMAVVPGRVLAKPGLSYSSNASAAIDSGASWNLRNVKFSVGARLDRLAVLVIREGRQNDFTGAKDPALRKVVDGFRVMCNKSGMRVGTLGEQAYAEVQLPRQGADRFRDNAIKEIEQILGGLMEQVAPELVLVMLPNDDKAIYNGLKWLCDVKLDLPTVCMQSNKVKKGHAQYFANVALKVNMKLGGINHKLDANSGTWLKSAPTMIMGMDVTHPARGVSVDGTPSIVAVVASVDEHFAQYPATLGIRRSGVEIACDLSDMFISRFELYRDRNSGKLPKRVILFRDGVSESQFVQVRRDELQQMKKAFERFGSYAPKLSIVVCGKRHHTRFYPTKAGDATEDGNPLPGTVVDRGVTPAYEFDFFLQAHSGLKGTTRPTHYFVVHDENGFKADDLQRLTNDLSYMFERATRAVSLVSPAYWADVACERGRCYLYKLLHGDNLKDDDTGVAKKSKGKKRANDHEAVFEKATAIWDGGVSGPRLRDTMYYL